MSNENINYKSASFRGAKAITPSDSAEVCYSAIYVGGTGNVAVTTPAGDTLTFVAVQVGTVLPICAVKVLATGTSATNLVGLE